MKLKNMIMNIINNNSEQVYILKLFQSYVRKYFSLEQKNVHGNSHQI